jgi:hypothetical protein
VKGIASSSSVGIAMTIQMINMIQENINKLILPENEKHKN